MEGLLGQAIAGSGSVILVTGDSGFGKTALAGEFLRRARHQDPPPILCRGRCVEQYGTGEAYLPFLDALGTLLVGRGRDAAVSLLSTYAPTWCLQLPAVVASTDARDALQQRTIGATKERMLREFGDLLEATAASATVVGLLEDVQWADPSTADVIRHVANRIARQRMLILLTMRPGELEAADHPLKGLLRDLRVNERCHEIALGPLGRDEVAAYLEARFPAHRFPPELGELIHHRTEGHPLFAASLVGLLFERDDVAVADGRWILKRPVSEIDLDVPEGVRGVIRRMVEALAEEDAATVRFGSVMGREFLSTVVAGALGADELALEERLARLARARRLIHTVGDEELPDGTLATRYRFSNALYQEILYEDLVGMKRVRLHCLVAEQLVRRYGAEAPRIATQLALHFENGRDFGAAATYYVHAGDNAARLYASGEAEEHYLHALRLVEKLPVEAVEERAKRSIALYQKLGTAQYAMGRFDLAIDSYTRMLDGARAIGASTLECSALGGLCRALFFAHRIEEMAVRTEEALRASERARSEVLRMEPLLAVSLLLQDSGDLAQCAPLLHEVIEMARRLGHKPSLLEGLVSRGIMHYWQSDYARAEERLAEAQSLASEVRDGFQLLVCLGFLGLSRGNLGRMSEALAALHQGIEAARRNGDRYWLPRMPNHLGWVHRELRDLKGAIDWDREGLRIAQQERILDAEANAYLNLAFDYTQAAQGEPAAAALEKARVASTRDRWFHWFFDIRLEVAQAEYWLVQGDLDGVKGGAERLLEAATRHDACLYIAVAHRLLADVALTRGQPLAAAALIGTALEQLRLHPAPLFAWRAHAMLGRVQSALGAHEEALRAYREAADIVRAIAASVDEEALRAIFLESSAVREVLDAAATMPA